MKSAIKNVLVKLGRNKIWEKFCKVRKYIQLCPPILFDSKIDDILILAPHPDDDVIGCGGMIAKYIKQAKNIRVLYITNGSKRGEGKLSEEIAVQRSREAKKALSYLGVKDFSFLHIEDQKVEIHLNELKEILKSILPKYKQVFTPFIFDFHEDHRFTTIALYQALEELKEVDINIWCYEVWNPCMCNTLIDITEYMEEKRKAISFHVSQLQGMDYGEKIGGLNAYRSMTLGNEKIKFCEGFYKAKGREFIKAIERFLS